MIIYIHVISVIISKTVIAQGRGLEENIEHEVAVARIGLKGKNDLGQHIKTVDPAFSAQEVTLSDSLGKMTLDIEMQETQSLR